MRPRDRETTGACGEAASSSGSVTWEREVGRECGGATSAGGRGGGLHGLRGDQGEEDEEEAEEPQGDAACWQRWVGGGRVMRVVCWMRVMGSTSAADSVIRWSIGEIRVEGSTR